MRVALVRHGRAVPGGHPDEDRPLTDAGRRAVRRTCAAWAAREGTAPARFLVSPLVRAVQTCELALAAFGLDGPAVVTHALVPEAAAGELLELLEGENPAPAPAPASVALVGHEPLLSRVATWLSGGAFPAGSMLPGTVVVLDLPAPGSPGRLAYVLQPDGDGEPRVLLG